MFSSIQNYIIAGLGIGLLIICGIFYWYFNHSENKIATLNQNQAKLEGAVEQQKTFITYMEQVIDTQSKAMIKLNRDQVAAEKDKENLLALLRKHDLEALAKNKPGMVEERINNATRKSFREIERDTNQ